MPHVIIIAQNEQMFTGPIHIHSDNPRLLASLQAYRREGLFSFNEEIKINASIITVLDKLERRGYHIIGTHAFIEHIGGITRLKSMWTLKQS